MRKSDFLKYLNLLILTVGVVASDSASAQVVSPNELPDSDMRALQLAWHKDLLQIAEDIHATRFSYPFYFSRKLDLDEEQQKRADQHSIRFERFNGLVVLAITGNYYAAYAGDKLPEALRAKDSFLKVVVPILRVTVPHFEHSQSVQGYAVEISHHVRTKVIGMGMEKAENLMVYFSQAAAIKLIQARDLTAEQAALLDGEIYINAEPISLWLDDATPRPVVAEVKIPRPSYAAVGASAVNSSDPLVRASAQLMLSASAESQPGRSNAATTGSQPMMEDTQSNGVSTRDTTPEALNSLQAGSQETLTRMTKELDPQAHFVAYAPPAFIAFRHGVYLELSLNTPLPDTARGSRYKLAALAFDEHISHLIRPAIGYWKSAQEFDGLAFSTTVHVPAKAAALSDNSVAVEFFFPFRALHCYEHYDCTGQQLLDAGTVLINGERAGLDLQRAEADGQ